MVYFLVAWFIGWPLIMLAVILAVVKDVKRKEARARKRWVAEYCREQNSARNTPPSTIVVNDTCRRLIG